VFTARYGLIPYMKHVTFRLLKVKTLVSATSCCCSSSSRLLNTLTNDILPKADRLVYQHYVRSSIDNRSERHGNGPTFSTAARTHTHTHTLPYVLAGVERRPHFTFKHASIRRNRNTGKLCSNISSAPTPLFKRLILCIGLHHENPPYLAVTHTFKQQFALHCTSHVCYTETIQLACVIRGIQCNGTRGESNGPLGVIQLSLTRAVLAIYRQNF
jgi:hypothetical protein